MHLWLELCTEPPQEELTALSRPVAAGFMGALSGEEKKSGKARKGK